MGNPMTDIRSSFGERIAFLRELSGESLQDVATAVGCSKAHMHEIESGRKINPSLNLIRSLAIHFMVPAAALVETPITAQYKKQANKTEKTLGTLISWMAQSAASPISQSEATTLLKMLDDTTDTQQDKGRGG